MASFVLLVLGGGRPQLDGGIKYVTLNLVAPCFLAAVGILYGVTGTLNLADLARKLDGVDGRRRDGRGDAVPVAFGIKAAVFPLFFWLPASYHTPPGAVSALFAGLLTKVGVYALIRVFTLLYDRRQRIQKGSSLVAGLEHGDRGRRRPRQERGGASSPSPSWARLAP